jgi:hypothetical protein
MWLPIRDKTSYYACQTGKKDAWNGAAGGILGGLTLGVRLGRLGAGIGAAAALAAVSLAVDVTGQKLVGSGMIDDGATPPRTIYPYPSGTR